jgi:hypothetical protein
MSLKPDEVQELNKVVTYWTGNTARRFTRRVKVRNKRRDGEIEAAGFEFPRHRVFVEMGVFGGLSKKEAIAQGKLNPKPWFNPVLRTEVPKLEKKVLDAFENLIVNASRLEIKNTGI